MNRRAIEVYTHYKSLYGSYLLLFRVQNNYEAYFDDATSISTILNIRLYTEPPVVKIQLPASNILDMAGELAKFGLQCKMIQQRNNDGEFALPDVSLLKNEQEMDF